MKIKWNWGTGIVIAIILFMAYIMTLVFMGSRQKFDLVEKDYYPKALEYQQQIDKEQNAKSLTEKVKVENQGDRLLVTFQSIFNSGDISGNYTFYRPSDVHGDIRVEIKPDTAGCQYLDLRELKKGKYILQIDYNVKGKSYFQEQPVFVRMF